MAIDFPASPSLNDQFTSGGVTYTWDGTVWAASGSAAFALKSGDTFTGRVTSETGFTAGGNPNGGTEDGCRLDASGAAKFSRTSGASPVIEGYTTGSATPTAVINADGSATFANTVGIGTTSAEDSLHIKSNSGAIRLENTVVSNNDSTIAYDNTDLAFHVDPNNVRGSSNITFSGDGNELMRIDSTGKMGIGVTPLRSLDVNSGTSSTYLRLTNDATGIANGDGFEIFVRNTDLEVGFLQRENSDMFFRTNDTERMRILSNGGITFNGDTATANALDDYEEGTWTPEFAGDGGTLGSYTYAVQSGTYTKVGNLVTAICYLQNITQVSAGNEKAQVTGLPFANGDSYEACGPVALGNFSVDATTTYNLTAHVASGASAVKFRRSRESAGAILVPRVDFTDGSSDIWFSITYRVA